MHVFVIFSLISIMVNLWLTKFLTQTKERETQCRTDFLSGLFTGSEENNPKISPTWNLNLHQRFIVCCVPIVVSF